MLGNRAGEVGHTAAASVSPCRNLGTSLVYQVALMPQQPKRGSAQSGLTGLGLGARGAVEGGDQPCLTPRSLTPGFIGAQ